MGTVRRRVHPRKLLYLVIVELNLNRKSNHLALVVVLVQINQLLGVLKQYSVDNLNNRCRSNNSNKIILRCLSLPLIGVLQISLARNHSLHQPNHLGIDSNQSEEMMIDPTVKKIKKNSNRLSVVLDHRVRLNNRHMQ